MKKTVLIISTLDTKGEETYYLRDKIESLGLKPLLMDISMRGEGPARADITPEKVAVAGGSSIEEIRASKERSRITNITIAGASRIAGEYFVEGKLDGVIGIGGSTGSLMATEVMRALPFSVPKLMISSTAALPGLATRYIGTGDIALFHSVIEISGLSDLLKNVVDRAAYALAGMVQGAITSSRGEKGKAIAMTMLGPCEKCASSVRTALEKKGYQVIGFSAAGIGDRAMEEMLSQGLFQGVIDLAPGGVGEHLFGFMRDAGPNRMESAGKAGIPQVIGFSAAGIGDRAMEEMLSQGLFQGVIDLAPGGVGEHLFGFMRDAGPNRMESAGKAGIPQVISTCSVNHMTPAKSKYKPEYHERRKYDLDRFRTWVRLSPDELRAVAKAFKEKLNRAEGPVKVLIPQRGWSSVDYPGNATYDPEEDRVFIEELQDGLNPEIEVLEINANMEDPEFARGVVETVVKTL